MRWLALLPLAALVSGTAEAFPDGPPWALDDQGCAGCHLQEMPARGSPALTLDGLPAAFVPGGAYDLTVRLADTEMVTAGYLLSADGGRFAARDGRSEGRAGQARSTAAGIVLTSSGAAAWRVTWTAPVGAGPVRFEAWANAANDDDSALGDRTHRRDWVVRAR